MLRCSRLAIGIFYCFMMAGCVAAEQQRAASPGCDRTCWESWGTCKASCQKMVDPVGHIAGSHESCEQICGSQRDTCDAGCLQGRQP